MVDLRLSAGISPDRATADDVKLLVPGLRDGSLVTAPWALARAIEGKVYTVQLGTGITPITGDTYDADQPFIALDVSEGFAAVLLKIQVYLEAGAGTVNTVIAETSDIKAGAGTSTPITPVNHKTDGGAAAGTTAFGAYSGDAADPVNGVEFWHDGDPYVQATTSQHSLFVWTYEAGPVVLVNTSSVHVHLAGGSDPTGYARITYVEMLSSEVS